MASLAQQKHWVASGVKYGYPLCCIVAFCSLEHMKDEKPRQLEGTGYVPCSVCNETKGLMQLVAAINSKRDKSLKPFPSEEA